MCGRYALYYSWADLLELYGISETQETLWTWEPSYNIAPGTVVPVIAWDGRRERKIVPMRWGLHPHWRKEPPEGRPLFNARVETAAEKPSFRTPFRRRRAIIPANGWYEWEGVERPKTPYFIYESQEGAGFAALWDQWRVDEGINLLSVTILTTSSNGPVKNLHHRMPVRLPRDRWDDWLNWGERGDRVLRHMKDGEDLEFHPVSTTVNSGRASGAELITPVS
jgi:putative SOS response-associated peptidase YedK